MQARTWLAIEFALLFIAAPVLMRIAMFDFGVPLFWALGPVLGVFAALAAFDKTFNVRESLLAPMPPGTVRSIAILFAVGVPVTLAAVWMFLPDQLFNLPRERTKLWLKMIVLYPFTSVLAQEFIYRVFFFHRYARLFSRPEVMIATSALVFALSHVIFRNHLAVVLSLAGGALFAWRYWRTRSFRAVWIEHTLWGWLLFTCGLGVYFFANSKNPAWG
ncbi:MAG: CPBP family intramembrane metalloprotease [Hyphomicrobiaceae bacterium]|nr:CPBP family intramembrane metalloprotease [Hyphomicrobiaceae bacterium]